MLVIAQRSDLVGRNLGFCLAENVKPKSGLCLFTCNLHVEFESDLRIVNGFS